MISRRPLGQTGEQVSELSLGASPFGNVFREVTLREACATLEAARDVGIDLIDVAPYYGLGAAEEKLGAALREVGREGFRVGTKVGRYGADEFDFSAARTRTSLEESLSRLGLESVDLVQVHDVEFGELEQIREETLPALAALRQEGKLRWIGVTGLPLKSLDTLADWHGLDVVLSYCRLTLADRALETRLDRYASLGLGTLNAAPFAMGLLTGGPTPDWHPAPADLRQRANRAAEHCRARGARIEDLALQFSLSFPRVATTVVGTASRDHLQRLAAVVGREPDPELLTEVEEILAPVQGLNWASGRPGNRDPEPAQACEVVQ